MKPRSKSKLILWWSKKDNDWMFSYPDRDGSTMTGVFFEMLKVEKNIGFLQPTERHPEKPEDLRTMLSNRGYDPDTLRITVDRYPRVSDRTESPERSEDSEGERGGEERAETPKAE